MIVLGLFFDNKLRFKLHLNNTISEIFPRLKITYIYVSFVFKKQKLFAQCLSVFTIQFSCCLLYTVLGLRTFQQNSSPAQRLLYRISRREQFNYKLKTVPWLNIDIRSKMHSVYLFRKICTKTPPCLYSKIPFVRFYSQKGHSHNISTFLQSFSDNFSTPSNYFLLLFKSKSIQSLIFL